MPKNVPLEEQEQEVVVEWLEAKGLKFSSIPNSTWTPSFKQKAKNKRQGLRPGLPDLLIIHNGKILFVEMKRKAGGVVSTAQKGWIKAINSVPNCQAVVAKGADEAIAQITKLLGV